MRSFIIPLVSIAVILHHTPLKSSLLDYFSTECGVASCESRTENRAVAGTTFKALIAKNEQEASVFLTSALDDTDRRSMEQQSPRTLKKIDRGEQLSVDDIKKMSKAGLSDNVIIGQIQSTKSVFYLSTADIIDLKNSGVSQRVIDYMIQTGNE